LALGGFVELGEVRFLGNFKHQVPAHQTRKNSPLPRTGSAHVLTLSNPARTAPLELGTRAACRVYRCFLKLRELRSHSPTLSWHLGNRTHS
jgi:hypothetical protein